MPSTANATVLSPRSTHAGDDAPRKLGERGPGERLCQLELLAGLHVEGNYLRGRGACLKLRHWG